LHLISNDNSLQPRPQDEMKLKQNSFETVVKLFQFQIKRFVSATQNAPIVKRFSCFT